MGGAGKFVAVAAAGTVAAVGLVASAGAASAGAGDADAMRALLPNATVPYPEENLPKIDAAAGKLSRIMGGPSLAGGPSVESYLYLGGKTAKIVVDGVQWRSDEARSGDVTYGSITSGSGKAFLRQAMNSGGRTFMRNGAGYVVRDSSANPGVEAIRVNGKTIARVTVPKSGKAGVATARKLLATVDKAGKPALGELRSFQRRHAVELWGWRAVFVFNAFPSDSTGAADAAISRYVADQAASRQNFAAARYAGAGCVDIAPRSGSGPSAVLRFNLDTGKPSSFDYGTCGA